MIPFNKPYYGKRAIDYVSAAIEKGSLQGSGETCRQVAELLSVVFGGRDIMLTASCTSALEVAARAAGFGPDDEVIVPAYSFASTAGAIAATGARPVFVDVSKENLCIDLAVAERAVTPRTRGIVAVHFAGQACDLDRFREFFEAHNLIAIEDAAHALFCKQGPHDLGTIGHFGCFSFQNGKVFSAGEGGALLVNDRRFLARAGQILNKGTNYPEFVEGKLASYCLTGEGCAQLMGGLPAALLRAQIEERDDIMARRSAIFDAYDAALHDAAMAAGWATISRQQNERLSSYSYWLMCRDAADRSRFMDALASRGVTSLSCFPALHRSNRAREMGWSAGMPLPVSERADDTLVRLPVFPGMTDEDVAQVIEAVRNYFDKPSFV